MDSGNSGSMQSSSGGDEEYDSRGESISTFLNNNNNNSLPHFGSISSHNSTQPFLSHHHQQQQQHPNNSFFDTAASLFPQSSNPQFNTNDLIWSSSRSLRSDHNFNNFTASSSAPSSNVGSAQLLHHNQNPFSGSGSGSLPTMQLQPSSIEQANVVRASSSAQPDHQPNVAKNPKKRTRASRRAPTTVLTTDTTNFRQMVQEFTGIPTAPFTGSPYTRRLDLFSTAGSSMRSGHLDSLGPLYPLRPSAQKVQVSPFMPQLSSSSASSSSLLSSSMIDALMPTNNTGNQNNNSIVGVSTASASTSTSTNFQLGSNHLGIQKQAQNLFNMENQILSFNAGASVFTTKSLQGSGGGGGGGRGGNTMNVPSLDELGISHEQQVSANLISGFQGRNNNNNNNVSSQARNDGNNLSRLWRNNNHDGGQENQRLRSFDANNGGGNYNKLNSSGNSSTSEFHPEINKGLENVCSTGEGPVSSWPCPSD